MGFEVLTKDEAASKARITRKALERRIRLGEGPAVVRIGGQVRVRSDELENWLRRCTVPASGQQVAA